MHGKHALPARTWRAEEDEIKPARANLPRGTNLGAFIRACVRTLGKDPAAILTAVADHWPPPPEIKGRPRKNPPPATD
jgi:hypothetical protein